MQPPRLALWIVNPTHTAYTMTIQIPSFPTAIAHISVLDNLSDNTIETEMVEGTPLIFDIVIPERSAYTIVAKQALSAATYLPLVYRGLSISASSPISAIP